MATLAYQVTGFAYQGAGQFAYQGGDGASTPEGWRPRRRQKELAEREEAEIQLILQQVLPVLERDRRGRKH